MLITLKELNSLYYIIYIPLTIAAVEPVLLLPPPGEKEFSVVLEGDGICISWSEESVGPVIAIPKNITINQVYICQITSLQDILVDKTTALVGVYVFSMRTFKHAHGC